MAWCRVGQHGDRLGVAARPRPVAPRVGAHRGQQQLLAGVHALRAGDIATPRLGEVDIAARTLDSAVCSA